MNVPHTSTTVSLEFRGPPGLTVNSAPQGLRSWMFAGAACVSGLVYLLRKGYSDGVRRRVIRRLDAIAPRTRYDEDKLRDGTIFNADCEYIVAKHLFCIFSRSFFLLCIFFVLSFLVVVIV